MKTKRLSDLEQIAELTGGENLLVEADGAAKRIPASRVGKVKTVNGNAPDENGNVEIEFPEIPEDKVQTVNGIEPDAEGNVQLPEPPEPTWAGLPDKPFEELIEKTYYVNQTYFRDDATFPAIEDLYLNETKQYVIVSVNGVEYKDPPMKTGKIGYDIYLCFGNPYLLNDNEGGFVDNGLPYCLYRKTAASSTEMKMYGNPDVVGQDGYYSIYKCVHVGTKTIEDKFIPESILRKGKLRKIYEKGDAVLQSPSISTDMEGNPLSLKGFIITVCYGTVSGSGSFSAKFTTEKEGAIDWGHTVSLSSNQSYNIHLWPVFGHYLPFQTAWANGLDKHSGAQINTNRFLSYETESMGAITGIEIDTSGLADGEFLADTTFEVWGIE